MAPILKSPRTLSLLPLCPVPFPVGLVCHSRTLGKRGFLFCFVLLFFILVSFAVQKLFGLTRSHWFIFALISISFCFVLFRFFILVSFAVL